MLEPAWEDAAGVPYFAKVKLYNASFKWTGLNGEVNGYFHSGHGDWAAEGDFFTLVPEAYDLTNYDRWGVAAPIAVEGRYNFGLGGHQGLTVMAGPEPFNGGGPQIIGKWFQTIKQYSFSAIYSQGLGTEHMIDDDVLPLITEDGQVLKPEARGALWFGWKPSTPDGTSFSADLGVMEANWQKLDEEFITNDNKKGIVEIADTLAFKARLNYSPIPYFAATLEGVYAGTVADSYAGTAYMGTLMTDNGAGNRYEAKLGLTGFYGNFNLQLNGLWRQPIVGPITNSDGVANQIAAKNPFRVNAGNREALKFEVVFAYDEQPASWIWNWNNNDQEGAIFAANVVFNYSLYEGATDPGTWLDDQWGRLVFPRGLPRTENMYSLSLRTVFNPTTSLRIINTFGMMRGQPNFGFYHDRHDTISGFQDELKFRFKRLVGGASVYLDMWGPESWNVDQDWSYPLRWSVELAWSFKYIPSLMDSTERVGIRWNGVTRDEYSPGVTAGTDPTDTQELELFFNFSF